MKVQAICTPSLTDQAYISPRKEKLEVARPGASGRLSLWRVLDNFPRTKCRGSNGEAAPGALGTRPTTNTRSHRVLSPPNQGGEEEMGWCTALFGGCPRFADKSRLENAARAATLNAEASPCAPTVHQPHGGSTHTMLDWAAGVPCS